MTYRPRNVSAEQFVVEAQPWPAGVAAAPEGTPFPYVFDAGEGIDLPIDPGDYVITWPSGRRSLSKRTAFEEAYEAVGQ